MTSHPCQLLRRGICSIMVCPYRVPSRASLLLIHRFIDENVDVYVILGFPRSEEGELRSLLSRVAITLEAYAIQSREATKVEDRSVDNHAPAKELIFAQTVDDVETPLLLFRDPCSKDDPHTHDRLHAVWKVTAFLSTLSYPCCCMIWMLILPRTPAHKSSSSMGYLLGFGGPKFCRSRSFQDPSG